jgi:hypothetical protein
VLRSGHLVSELHKRSRDLAALTVDGPMNESVGEL